MRSGRQGNVGEEVEHPRRDTIVTGLDIATAQVGNRAGETESWDRCWWVYGWHPVVENQLFQVCAQLQPLQKQEELEGATVVGQDFEGWKCQRWCEKAAVEALQLPQSWKPMRGGRHGMINVRSRQIKEAMPDSRATENLQAWHSELEKSKLVLQAD